jgi:serine/threonine protein kinase
MKYLRKLSDTLFGELMLVRDNNGRLLAAKSSHAKLMESGRTARGIRAYDDPVKEAEVLRVLGWHPNIASYAGETRVGDRHVLYTEYVEGNDLFDLVADGYPLGMPEYRARRVFRDVVRGLMHMRAKGFVHLDVSMENVMVDGVTGTAKLIDMGSANSATRALRDGVSHAGPGKNMYVAPEMVCCTENVDLTTVDVWSLGVLLYTTLTRTPPYDKPLCSDACFVALRDGKLRQLVERTGATLSEKALTLIGGMLRPAKHRFTLEQVYSSPWLQTEDNDLQSTEG